MNGQSDSRWWAFEKRPLAEELHSDLVEITAYLCKTYFDLRCELSSSDAAGALGFALEKIEGRVIPLSEFHAVITNSEGRIYELEWAVFGSIGTLNISIVEEQYFDLLADVPKLPDEVLGYGDYVDAGPFIN